MAKNAPKVLALDVGFAHTGVVLAEIDGGKPSGFNLLRVDCIHTDKVKKRYGKAHIRDIYKSDLDVERAGHTYLRLKEFLDGTCVSMIVAEAPSGGGKSANAVRSMGIATGVLGVLVALMPEAVFINMRPDAIRQHLGGSAAIGKMGVERAVRAYFNEYAWPAKKRDSEHIFDAAGALLASKTTAAYTILAKGATNARNTL